MKKCYVKPTGNIIAMSTNENIATSMDYNSSSGNTSELTYTYGPDGNKYIAFSTVNASNTGNPEFDQYTDLITAHIRGIYFNCSSGVVPH